MRIWRLSTQMDTCRAKSSMIMGSFWPKKTTKICPKTVPSTNYHQSSCSKPSQKQIKPKKSARKNPSMCSSPTISRTNNLPYTFLSHLDRRSQSFTSLSLWSESKILWILTTSLLYSNAKITKKGTQMKRKWRKEVRLKFRLKEISHPNLLLLFFPIGMRRCICAKWITSNYLPNYQKPNPKKTTLPTSSTTTKTTHK